MMGVFEFPINIYIFFLFFSLSNGIFSPKSKPKIYGIWYNIKNELDFSPKWMKKKVVIMFACWIVVQIGRWNATNETFLFETNRGKNKKRF